ncbi:hypothetical protein B0E54_00748 [Micromonospora sp. MH99]|nr:hypothetical protein [Micromonospora sp. MH99]
MLVEVLAAHLPAYTKMVVGGNRGGLPVPLILGPSCVARVTDVAPDVFHVAPGDIVLDTALLDAGDNDEILVGWIGLGGSGAGSERTDRMRTVWHDGVFAERALCAKETMVKLPGAENYPDPARLAFLPWLCIAASGLHAAGPLAGRDVAVIGATGQLGGAAVLVALAEGAATVTAVGRNKESLDRLAELSPRVRTHRLTGDRATDAAGIGPVDVALDTLGGAYDGPGLRSPRPLTVGCGCCQAPRGRLAAPARQQTGYLGGCAGTEGNPYRCALPLHHLVRSMTPAVPKPLGEAAPLPQKDEVPGTLARASRLGSLPPTFGPYATLHRPPV